VVTNWGNSLDEKKTPAVVRETNQEGEENAGGGAFSKRTFAFGGQAKQKKKAKHRAGGMIGESSLKSKGDVKVTPTVRGLGPVVGA